MIKKVLFAAVNRIFRIANTSVLDLVFGQKNRFSPLVLLTAACVQLVFSPAASALILLPRFGFGAGTEIQGVITQVGHVVVEYGGGAPGLHRDTGGDGVLSAFALPQYRRCWRLSKHNGQGECRPRDSWRIRPCDTLRAASLAGHRTPSPAARTPISAMCCGSHPGV